MNKETSEAAVISCFNHIINNSHEKALNYAVEYAKAGLDMTGYELRIQCLYVLSNMTRWRGDLAKEVRRVLKEFTNMKRRKT